MKPTMLLLGLILLCSGHHSVAKKNIDYATYFAGILSAEHKLANDDLRAALDAYASLFPKFDFVFARDAYNALQLAILTGKQAQQDALLTLCAKSGVPDYVLSKNPLVHAAYAGKDKRFHELFAKGNAVYLRRTDTALRAEMQRRYKLEQGNKGNSNFEEICTDNFNRILELSKQGRFPGEQLIGVNDALENGFVLPTLLHYPYAYVLLHDYLWASLHRGEAQPLSLMYLYSFNQTRTSILYTSRIPVDTKHFKIRYNLPFGLESPDKTAVDGARKKVWLRPQSQTQMIKDVAQGHGMDFRGGW